MRCRLFAAAAAVVCALQHSVPSTAAQAPAPAAQRTDRLPEQLNDQEFWTLVTDFAEPNGSFRSDNLLSNERFLQNVIPDLTKKALPGGVFIGVGPEQNFTYMAAVMPKMAFIVDLRRGNRDLQLMYKALFELSTDRADFLSKLFARPRPLGAGRFSTAARLFDVYSQVDVSETLYLDTLKAIKTQLLTVHGFPLSEDDVRGITYVYRAFCYFGPRLTYNSTGGGFADQPQPAYSDMMVAADANGQQHSYLANETAFSFVKDLQRRNMIVPVVGNFAGPKAIRAIGTYLSHLGATVSVFYLSNVEQYLRQDGTLKEFCRSAETLPADDASLFIRAERAGGFGLMSRLGPMTAGLKACLAAAPPSDGVTPPR
jgi:hypothetical protein